MARVPQPFRAFISGLFNRGKQNEYVELEAATKCSLEGLMLLRYRYGKNGLPVQSETRVFSFPGINLRKGNLVRVYTFSHNGKKKEKDEALGKAAYNFSWNLDHTVWESPHIEAHIMQEGNGMSLYPDDPVADTDRHEDTFTKATTGGHSLFDMMMMSALAGNFSVIGNDGITRPVQITGVPEEVQAAIDAKDYEKAYAMVLSESAK